jgi:hypothetical protein
MITPWNLLSRPAREPIRRWVLSAFPRGAGGHVDYDHPVECTPTSLACSPVASRR